MVDRIIVIITYVVTPQKLPELYYFKNNIKSPSHTLTLAQNVAIWLSLCLQSTLLFK